MRKKIALLIIGAVVFIGGFLIYLHLSGATFMSARKAQPTTLPGIEEDRPPTFESRRPNGDLEYLLSTQKAVPFKDANGNLVQGEYALTEPKATYYTDDGNIIFIRADRGTIMVDETSATAKSNKSGKPLPRGGHLSGNVILTYGPPESFTDNSVDLKPKQFQVRFEQDLDLNYAEQILTSPGLVHLRSEQVVFDGENLTIAFNREMKRIELFRIDPPPGSGKNNYMLIKNIGRDTLPLDDTAGESSTRPAKGTAVRASAPAEPARVAATPAAAPEVRATTNAATKPGKEKTPPTTYKVSFGKEVIATLGQRTLTSDQLFVMFMGRAPGEKSDGTGDMDSKKSDAQKSAGGSSAASGATSAGAGSVPAATGPAKTPVAAAKGDDLEVRWTGPMEMRPAADTDLKLVDASDKALEALGTAERPVIVKDPTYSMTGGRLWYHKAEQRFEVERNGLGPVVATDKDPVNPTLGSGRLVCEGLSFFRAANLVHIKGPGEIEVPPGLMGRTDQKEASEKPVVATWERELDLELANAGKGGDPGKAKRIRHAVFTGKSDITSSDFHIDSQMLDVLLAAAGADAKGTAKVVAEHVLATGSVHLKYPHQQGGTIDEAAKPNGLNADRVELLTAKSAGALAPRPSSLLANGNVEAWSFAPHRENGKETGKLDKQTIYTPKLDVELEPKSSKGPAAPAGAGAVADAGARIGKDVQPKTLVASEGVIVELEGFQPETVSATGRTLTVHMNADQGKESAVAVIDGEGMPDGSIKRAQLTEGLHKIGGEHIELNQKSKMISIPGPGEFVFVQPAESAKPGGKAKPATPVRVTWTKKMDFDGRSMMARFFGDVDGRVFDRPDEESELTCHEELDVQLARGGDAAAGGAPQAGKGLRSLRAAGNVVALGAKKDEKDGTILTALDIHTNLLTYDEATKTLNAPGAGKLGIIDNRTEKPTAAATDSAKGSQGKTKFDWSGGLTYEGSKNLITFSNEVYMVHQPAKPMKAMPGLGDAGGAAKKGADANPPVMLWADELKATLLASKEAGQTTNSNPLEMGSGSEQKLDNVVAVGNSRVDAKLEMGEESVTSHTLTFDAVHNLATAEATPGNTGQLVRPNEAIADFRKVVWDMTKNENAFTVTGIVGTIQQ